MVWYSMVVLLMMLSVIPAHAVTRYMATNGSDANDCGNGTGTPGGSQQITKPKATLASALPCMAAGDTLYLRGGTYNQRVHSDTQPIPVGTAGNVITLASYPGETAILAPTGSNNIISFYGYNIAYAIQYITMDRLVLDGANMNDSGLLISGPAGGASEPHHIIFQNGIVRNSRPQNIHLYGYNNVIKNSLVHNSRESYGIYMGGHDNIIENNTIYNNAGYAVQVYEGTPGLSADNIIVRNNRMYGNGYIRTFSAMTVGTGTGSKVYNNLIYSNFGGIDVHGISVGIFNNTLYSNSPRTAIELSNATTPTIQNNIMYQNAGGLQIVGTGNSGVVQAQNLTTNPSFVNAGAANFKLNAGSAMINTGVTVATVTTDFDGITRPQGAGYDVGAYEFTDGTAVPLHLVFTAPPVTTFANVIMPQVTVCAKDPTEVTATSYVGQIYLAITTNPGVPPGTLTGGAGGAATAGCRSFPGLSIDEFGTGYQILAVAVLADAAEVLSPLFDILEVTVTPPQALKVGIVQ